MQTGLRPVCVRSATLTATPGGISIAIFHLSVKVVSRSTGRSATAAAAYRCGIAITDSRTGLLFDYRRKKGVVHTELVLPANAPFWAADRERLWNEAERAEHRRNSTVAREFVIALPEELPADKRCALAVEFANELVKRHGCAADVAIHSPGRHGDQRNYHAHILLSTRRLMADGFSEKTRELDDQKSGEVLRWRERYASIQNNYLKANGGVKLVDHRSHRDRGITDVPGKHFGHSAMAYERRTLQSSRKRITYQEEVVVQLERAKLIGAWSRLEKELHESLVDLSCDLVAALNAREEVLRRPCVSDEQANVEGEANFPGGPSA